MTQEIAQPPAGEAQHSAPVPASRRAQGEIVVICGDRFAVSDTLGDILPGAHHGFFAYDTRFLSTYQLRLDGGRPLLLSARNAGHVSACIYATNASWSESQQGAMSLQRRRHINGTMAETITLSNHTGKPQSVQLSLEFGADFLDIFEVRGFVPPEFEVHVEHDPAGRRLSFVAQHDSLLQRAEIELSVPAQLAGATASYEVSLLPHEEWQLEVQVRPLQLSLDGIGTAEPARPHDGGFTVLAEPPRSWEHRAIETNEINLALGYRQALDDLRSLEITTADGHQILAAGLPWYVAVFGRDSIITAFETLLVSPKIAVGTLRALAAYQAREHDDFRDAQPGKFPHEIRNGRLARLGRVPHARYYGTIDATPLWLILLSETYRWTGDLQLVRDLLPSAEAALHWIDQYGDVDGDGFVEYGRRSERGLDNQGWKDSSDSIQFANGRLATGPIALVEVQAYVYDAKRRMAELYQLLGQADRAAQLTAEADRLKAAFNDRFWMPEHGYYALALDGEKRQVDSITSNPGHALWCGIVDPDKAAAVAERIGSDELFSGWGVRTMATSMAGYNPVSYHNGSVWPHDSALVAAGLARYGYGELAVRILRGLVDASAAFPQHRLPELFAGYPREPIGFPVEYPAANAPQAWAAGAMVLALQTMLGIQPSPAGIISNPLPGAPVVRIQNEPADQSPTGTQAA